MEMNWANEASLLRARYMLEETDDRIKEMSKEEWKKKVKSKIREKALSDLIKKKETLSKGNSYPVPTDLKTQKYFFELDSSSARILFQVRCKVLDVKVWKRYKYKDVMCRLCESEEESIEHILWGCHRMPVCSEYHSEMDLYSTDMEVMKAIVRRVKDF